MIVQDSLKKKSLLESSIHRATQHLPVQMHSSQAEWRGQIDL